jgi:hypothetical protein
VREYEHLRELIPKYRRSGFRREASERESSRKQLLDSAILQSLQRGAGQSLRLKRHRALKHAHQEVRATIGAFELASGDRPGLGGLDGRHNVLLIDNLQPRDEESQVNLTRVDENLAQKRCQPIVNLTTD